MVLRLGSELACRARQEELKTRRISFFRRLQSINSQTIIMLQLKNSKNISQNSNPYPNCIFASIYNSSEENLVYSSRSRRLVRKEEGLPGMFRSRSVDFLLG